MLASFRNPAIATPVALAIGLLSGAAHASSHREAPFITALPKVDATDFYMFRSYGNDRSPGDGYVTLIANYQPLQEPGGGPNYFALEENALYAIHVDNNGDNRQDLSFEFRFRNSLAADGAGTALKIGDKNVPIPLIQSGPVNAPGDETLNRRETYSVTLVRGANGNGSNSGGKMLTNASGGGSTFIKPVDNIGTKTLPNYADYAARHIYNVNVPDCSMPAKLFVGQRQEAFAVNVGPIFDLVNVPSVNFITDPANKGAVENPLSSKNVTTLALEVHKSCLTNGDDVIGGWTTASLNQERFLGMESRAALKTNGTAPPAEAEQWKQVSRLANPLVNEVVIGLKDKDKFNASRPEDDAQFADYVTNPTLPALLEIALGTPNIAPTNFPRTDLVTTFLTGIKGVNQPKSGKALSEMMRLNTSTQPVPFAQQKRLGVLEGDLAGYPNGRRPKDDVTDISLVAVMGGLCMANGNDDKLGFGRQCSPRAVPLKEKSLTLHDAVDQAEVPLLDRFPYLNTPLPGAK
ncbi:DUF4331 domain-containing protein [Caldimonas tepidiphila]|uniref:DUF4331 domain-containing protein n=1 Tax=Caldimonas tepidiphila TaxID=2315841 RepID=UPI000E5A1177|nr:DUF4331 domain-containing protein [Caldimonas tepidiphila]